MLVIVVDVVVVVQSGIPSCWVGHGLFLYLNLQRCQTCTSITAWGCTMQQADVCISAAIFCVLLTLLAGLH